MLALKQVKAKRPAWLRTKLTNAANFKQTATLLKKLKLATVCQQAACPNISNCFARGYATFLLLGEVCTRNCLFCQIKKGEPQPPVKAEPERLATAVKRLNLKRVVLTSVTRDDLTDGGASHFAACVQTLRKKFPNLTIELLIPDFRWQPQALNLIFASQPDIIGHNIETVARLYPLARPQANYNVSLAVLEKVAAAGFRGKTGLMLGLGETYQEIVACLNDIYQTGVREVVIGQYLPPTPKHLPVKRYYAPAFFQHLALVAYNIGFNKVVSSPLARSSWGQALPLECNGLA